MSDKTGWKCILEFDDQSPSFALGFQAGEIWSATKSREPFELLFSGEILELVQRIPSRCDYDFQINEVVNGWYKLNATPA